MNNSTIQTSTKWVPVNPGDTLTVECNLSQGSYPPTTPYPVSLYTGAGNYYHFTLYASNLASPPPGGERIVVNRAYLSGGRLVLDVSNFGNMSGTLYSFMFNHQNVSYSFSCVSTACQVAGTPTLIPGGEALISLQASGSSGVTYPITILGSGDYSYSFSFTWP